MVTSVTGYVAWTQGSRRAGEDRCRAPLLAPDAVRRHADQHGDHQRRGSSAACGRAHDGASSRVATDASRIAALPQEHRHRDRRVGRRRRLPAAPRSIVRSGPAPSSAALLRSPPGKVGPQSAAETARARQQPPRACRQRSRPVGNTWRGRRHHPAPLEASGAAQTPSEAMKGISTRETGQLPSRQQSTNSGRNGSTAGHPAATARPATSRSNLSRGTRAVLGGTAASSASRNAATAPPSNRRNGTRTPSCTGGIEPEPKDRTAPSPTGRSGSFHPGTHSSSTITQASRPSSSRTSTLVRCTASHPANHRAGLSRCSALHITRTPPPAKVATSTACSPTMSSGHLIIPPSLRHNFQFPLRSYSQRDAGVQDDSNGSAGDLDEPFGWLEARPP